jgi:hypothetical protein
MVSPGEPGGELKRHHPRPRPVESREQIFLYLATEQKQNLRRTHLDDHHLHAALSPDHPPLNPHSVLPGDPLVSAA